MAGSVLSVGVVAVTAALAIGYGAAGAVAGRAAHAAGVADAAALAAADAVSGYLPGVPCERAADVAAAGGAALEDCALEGHDAIVEVSVSAGAFTVRARARAGPPR